MGRAIPVVRTWDWGGSNPVMCADPVLTGPGA